MSWTSSSSSSRKTAPEASSPIITMRIAALRSPLSCWSLPLIFTIEPAPDDVGHPRGVGGGLFRDVLGQNFRFLGGPPSQFQRQQILRLLARVLSGLLGELRFHLSRPDLARLPGFDGNLAAA